MCLNIIALQVVFLVKGPIYLVCISCTEEPHESLSEQLELLYGQVLPPSPILYIFYFRLSLWFLYISKINKVLIT